MKTSTFGILAIAAIFGIYIVFKNQGAVNAAAPPLGPAGIPVQTPRQAATQQQQQAAVNSYLAGTQTGVAAGGLLSGLANLINSVRGIPNAASGQQILAQQIADETSIGNTGGAIINGQFQVGAQGPEAPIPSMPAPTITDNTPIPNLGFIDPLLNGDFSQAVPSPSTSYTDNSQNLNNFGSGITDPALLGNTDTVSYDPIAA